MQSAPLLWGLSGFLIDSAAIDVGIARPFSQVFDCDLHDVYNALALNDRLPQRYFDHPQYGYSLILSWRLKLGHLVGANPAKLSEFPASLRQGMTERSMPPPRPVASSGSQSTASPLEWRKTPVFQAPAATRRIYSDGVNDPSRRSWWGFTLRVVRRHEARESLTWAR